LVLPIGRPKALGPLPPITHSQHRRNQAIFRVFHTSELGGHNCRATLARADDGTAAALRPGAFLSHPKKRRFHTGYFESEPPAEEADKRQFGYSRDRRSDCVQVVIGLIVTPEGFPVAYEVLAGNTSDKTTLRSFLQRIEAQYGKADRIWLMDRKRVTNPRVDSGPEGAVTCELLKAGA
jgi:hypothetical protein